MSKDFAGIIDVVPLVLVRLSGVTAPALRPSRQTAIRQNLVDCMRTLLDAGDALGIPLVSVRAKAGLGPFVLVRALGSGEGSSRVCQIACGALVDCPG